MGKKSKKSEAVSSEPDPNLFYGTGKFTLPNGDSYEGEYCAHRYGLIWRQGHGVYTTKDKQTYEGDWIDDKLVQQKEVIIKFPSGEEYRGCTLQDKYAGAGTYLMENKMNLSCMFADNRPNGNVILIDINGRVWEGQAGVKDVLLLPENLYYFNIAEDKGIGKLKSKYQLLDEEVADEFLNGEEDKELSDRELEKMIFAKTTKTLNDIDFTESKWCQRYLRYKTMKSKISDKLKIEEESVGSPESLTDEERKWQRKFQKHKLRQKEKKKQKAIEKAKESLLDTSLLETFYSKEFKNSCVPVKIFHPSCDWVDNYNTQSEEIQSPPEEEAEKEPEIIVEVKKDKKAKKK